ncbi:hypothetical protein MGP2080_14906 [marine gamma proteobacterium HTCC2080]|nr:hypothetical protein MGP2080_14906 [marine gamma proteobacterium HTCC2080]
MNPDQPPLPSYLEWANTWRRIVDKHPDTHCQYLGTELADDGSTLVSVSVTHKGHTTTVKHPAAGDGQSALLNAYMRGVITALAEAGVEI